MGKLSYDDKMHIQTLHEQRLGPKAIMKLYPDKKWKLSTVKSICHQINETGLAVVHKSGSGQPKTAQTASNIVEISEMLYSQEDQPGTSRSTRQTASELGNSERSVRRIVKIDFNLATFWRIPAQVLSTSLKQKPTGSL